MKHYSLPWFRIATTIFDKPLAVVAGVLLCFSPIAASGQSVTFSGTESVLFTGLYAPYGGAGPLGIAVDTEGDVFIVINIYGDLVSWTKTATGYGPETVLIMGTANGGVAVDRSGDVFFTGSDIYSTPSYFVQELPKTPMGYGPQETLPAAGLSNPLGLAIDAAGDVFIADTGNDRVVELPKAPTGYGAQTPLPATGLNTPRGVAVDSAGDVFIADAFNNRVVELPWTGAGYGAQSNFGSGYYIPNGVAVDSAGNVFITDAGVPGTLDTGEVVEVPKTGSVYGPQVILAAGGSFPFGVVVNGADDVFIANNESTDAVEVQVLSVDFGYTYDCGPGNTIPAPCSQTLTLNYNITAGGTLGTPQVLTGGMTHLDFTRAKDSTCTGAVTAGSTCTVNVTFTPLATGTRNGSVEITDSAGTVIATTLISGLGVAPPTGTPVAQAKPYLGFGTIYLGTSETLPLTVTNVGAGTMTVEPSISTYAGTPSHSYTVTGSTCGGGVTNGNSCTLQVEFVPTSVGQHDDVLTLQTNGDANPTVDLAGKAADLSVLGGDNGAPLDFGSVASGSTEVKLLTVTNVGLPDAVTVQTTITGNSYSILTTSENTCLAAIAPGQSCTLPVQFSPTKSGLHDDLLSLTQNAGGVATTVWLTGSTP